MKETKTSFNTEFFPIKETMLITKINKNSKKKLKPFMITFTKIVIMKMVY